MATGPRDIDHDAFFMDEWNLLPFLIANPRGVHWNRFTNVIPDFFGGPPLVSMMSAQLKLQNPLDPNVTFGLAQPEVIPAHSQGTPEGYVIFVPPAMAARLALGATANVTLVFCVWSEMNRHGLRTFFLPRDDRVIITVSGNEGSDTQRAWGVGITDQIIRDLFAQAGFPGASYIVDIVAGYSTGYRGVNGTINNSLIDISSVRRLVFLDALYRGDDPAPGQNTNRMLQKVRAVNPNIELIIYEVTPGGTPRDAAGHTAVALPSSAKFIDLKREENGLGALIMARISDAGVADGYLLPNQIPASLRALAANLPPRGSLASSPLTEAGASNGTLANWANANRANVNAAVLQSAGLVSLIVNLNLTGYQFPDTGSMRHDGFVPEFGWEFLAG